jgi:hypothetical protein
MAQVVDCLPTKHEVLSSTPLKKTLKKVMGSITYNIRDIKGKMHKESDLLRPFQ